MNLDTPIADRVTALVLFCLGIAMTYGGFVMDRLEIRQIHPASIPGLVPIVLGLALAFCAMLLWIGADKSSDRSSQSMEVSWPDVFVALTLCAIYALGLVGNIHFGIATAIFVTVFSGWFLWPSAIDATTARAAKLRTAIGVTSFGVAAAILVSVLFRYAFLVRLP